ncbi:AMP-binding protein [Nocardia vermiculata]|uniref:AMP-binding protein n=1 Tax=Nocardia vermiculata TaxID=257274 RepID=UPI0008315417|nr:class I adenylate-forming enzyme family protein [Nocardia vermiculata]
MNFRGFRGRDIATGAGRPALLFSAVTTAMRMRPYTTVSTAHDSRTFGDLLSDVTDKAARLDAVLRRPRSRVLVALGNYPGYVSTMLALLARGDIPVLANPALPLAAMRALIEECGIDAVIASGQAGGIRLDERSWAQRTDFDGDRPALHRDTELCRVASAPSRRLVCLEYSATAVLNAATAWVGASKLREGDRTLCFSGLFGRFGFHAATIPTLIAGADLVLPDGTHAPGNIHRHLVAETPTVLVAEPAVYQAMVQGVREDLPPDVAAALRGLRLRLSPHSVATTVAQRVRAVSGPITICYGLDETGPVAYGFDAADGGSGVHLLSGVRMSSRSTDGEQFAQVHTKSQATTYLNEPGEFDRSISGDGSYLSRSLAGLPSSVVAAC